MVVLTLANGNPADAIGVARRYLASISAAHPDRTRVTLTDGRRFLGRETFVAILAPLQDDQRREFDLQQLDRPAREEIP